MYAYTFIRTGRQQTQMTDCTLTNVCSFSRTLSHCPSLPQDGEEFIVT